MSQKLIGIGGSHGGAGKTYVACQMIRALASVPRSVGAIKATPDPLYTSVTDDPGVIGEPGKDTALMGEAGAAEVFWVRAQGQTMAEALGIALERLSDRDVIIVEGNSAVEVLKTDIVLFIGAERPPGEPGKESAVRILAMADVVVHEGEAPQGAPENARKFRREETGDYTAHVMALVNNKGA